LARDGAGKVCHDHGVLARIGALRIRDCQGRVGHAGQAGIVEAPLIAHWLVAEDTGLKVASANRLRSDLTAA